MSLISTFTQLKYAMKLFGKHFSNLFLIEILALVKFLSFELIMRFVKTYKYLKESFIIVFSLAFHTYNLIFIIIFNSTLGQFSHLLFLYKLPIVNSICFVVSFFLKCNLHLLLRVFLSSLLDCSLLFWWKIISKVVVSNTTIQ